ncbi:MAG: hypothetical protein ABSC63_16285 [Candidatus Binataceae bacterium]
MQFALVQDSVFTEQLDRLPAMGLALPVMAALSGHNGVGQASDCRPMESVGTSRDDRTHMLKHAENTMAVNSQTLDFSTSSEFSVGTGDFVADSLAGYLPFELGERQVSRTVKN